MIRKERIVNRGRASLLLTTVDYYAALYFSNIKTTLTLSYSVAAFSVNALQEDRTILTLYST